jgi:hypothetical protein
MGMIKPRNSLHLALKEPCCLTRHLTILLISGICADHLNSYLPRNSRIFRKVDLAHCSFSEQA